MRLFRRRNEQLSRGALSERHLIYCGGLNDGSEPSANNPNAQVINSSSGPAYGQSWYPVTFRAVAFKAGQNDSEESSETFYYDAESSSNAPQLAAAATGSAQPAYDHNGNLIYYKNRTYTYDAQNRLRLLWNGSVLVAEYYYDGKNRQIARNLKGMIRFSVWDGWELVEEWANATTRATGYLQGSTGVIKSWTVTSAVYYYQDKLGSTTHIANASGVLLEGYRYDLFGTPTYYDANGQPKPAQVSGHGIVDLYAGERWIPELGLYDLRNRFMSPELGRFLQADPIGFKGDASNLYRYCHNDPENFTDPMGLNPPPKDVWQSQLTSRGEGDWDFVNGRVALAQINLQQQQPAGNENSAVAPKDEGKKVTTNTHQQASKMLRSMVRGTRDSTGAVAVRKNAKGEYGPPYSKDPVTGRLVPRSGSASFGYSREEERLPMHEGEKTLIIVHFHSRKGEGSPSDHDWAMVKQEHAPMYFSSRELAKTGNYLILREGGGKELRFDRELLPSNE